MPETLEDVRQGTGPGNPPAPPTEAEAGLGTSQPTPLPSQPTAVVPGSAPPPEVQHQAPDQVAPHIPGESFASRTYHGILAALGGANDVSYNIDPSTGKMVQSVAASGPGTQWKRIISGALTGYAAGAGQTGPGSTARKFGAGIQAGQQQAKEEDQTKRQNASEDFERQQKLATSNLQNAFLAHNLARSTFELNDQQLQASEREILRYDQWHKLMASGGQGSRLLNTFPDASAAYEALNQSPELHDHLAKGEISLMPHVENGRITGVDAAVVTPTWQQAKYGEDLHVRMPVPGKTDKDGKPVFEDHVIPKGSITNDDANKILMAQGTEEMQNRRLEEAQRHAEQMEEIGMRNAAANERKADAAEERAARGPAGTIAPEDMPGTVKAVGEGRVSMPTLGRLIAKNPNLSEEITKAYPDFREGAIKTFDKQQTEFTSGKTGGALNAAGTSAQHLTRLLQLNTPASHIPGTPAYRAYMSQVLPAAEELSKYYGGGKATVSGVEHYQKLLGGIGPGRSDAIYTTMGALADKFGEYQQQWQNSLPSKAWAIPMPTVTPEAQADLKSVEDYLAQHDPKYVRKIAAGQPQVTPSPGAMGSTSQQAPVNTGTTPKVAPQGSQLPPEAVAHLKTANGQPMRMTSPDGTDFGVWQINQAGQPVRVGN